MSGSVRVSSAYVVESGAGASGINRFSSWQVMRRDGRVLALSKLLLITCVSAGSCDRTSAIFAACSGVDTNIATAPESFRMYAIWSGRKCGIDRNVGDAGRKTRIIRDCPFRTVLRENARPGRHALMPSVFSPSAAWRTRRSISRWPIGAYLAAALHHASHRACRIARSPRRTAR